jgi:hypothetical protein
VICFCKADPLAFEIEATPAKRAHEGYRFSLEVRGVQVVREKRCLSLRRPEKHIEALDKLALTFRKFFPDAHIGPTRSTGES